MIPLGYTVPPAYGPPPQPGMPSTMPPGFVPSSPAPGPSPGTRKGLMVSGAVIRIVGAILGGVALIMLGGWIANPLALANPSNPLAPFQALANILYVSGIAVMLTGIGWTLQTWARS